MFTYNWVINYGTYTSPMEPMGSRKDTQKIELMKSRNNSCTCCSRSQVFTCHTRRHWSWLTCFDGFNLSTFSDIPKQYGQFTLQPTKTKLNKQSWFFFIFSIVFNCFLQIQDPSTRRTAPCYTTPAVDRRVRTAARPTGCWRWPRGRSTSSPWWVKNQQVPWWFKMMLP